MSTNERLAVLRGLLGNLPAVEAVQECAQILQDWPEDDISGYMMARTFVDTAMLQRAAEAATTLQSIGAFFPDAVPATMFELHFVERVPPDEAAAAMNQLRRAIDAALEGRPSILGTSSNHIIKTHTILPSVVMEPVSTVDLIDPGLTSG